MTCLTFMVRNRNPKKNIRRINLNILAAYLAMRNRAYVVYVRWTGMKLRNKGTQMEWYSRWARKFPRIPMCLGTHGKQTCMYLCLQLSSRTISTDRSKEERLRPQYRSDHVRNFSIVKHSKYGGFGSTVFRASPSASRTWTHVCRN